MLRTLGRLFDGIFVFVGGLLFSQLPFFTQQYQQQLMGHIQELKLQVDALNRIAETLGKPLDQYIQKFRESSDPDFASQGSFLNVMVERLNELNATLTSFQEASVLKRPFVMLAHFNSDVAASTWSSFSFGLSFTVEALVYFLLGMSLFYFLFLGISYAFLRVVPKKA